jgi:AcrR family transcriptional regulator
MDKAARTSPADPVALESSARERILDAAARLYADHGYEGTSMRRIAEEAGVTKPLIFYHFENKERLFSTLLRESIDTCQCAHQELLARDIPARERIRGLLRDHMAIARRQPAVYHFAYHILTMPRRLPLGFDYKAEGRRIFHEIVQVIEVGIARRELRPVDPDVVAVAIVSAVGMYVSAVLSGAIEAIPDHVEESLFDLIMRGLEEVRG